MIANKIAFVNYSMMLEAPPPVMGCFTGGPVMQEAAGTVQGLLCQVREGGP